MLITPPVSIARVPDVVIVPPVMPVPLLVAMLVTDPLPLVAIIAFRLSTAFCRHVLVLTIVVSSARVPVAVIVPPVMPVDAVVAILVTVPEPLVAMMTFKLSTAFCRHNLVPTIVVSNARVPDVVIVPPVIPVLFVVAMLVTEPDPVP